MRAGAAVAATRDIGGRLGLTRGAIAAIATMAAAGIGTSLMPPLVSLNLAAQGVSERTIGLLIATIAASALAVTPLASPLAARIGTARLIAASVLAAAILFPCVWFVDQVALLFPLLFVYGTALTLCFTLSEYWINAATPEHRRGLVMGIYATVLSIGFAIGPGIVALLGFASVRPFLLGAAIMAAAAIPVIATRSASPDFDEAPRRRFAAFIFAVPVATLGVFVFAMSEQSGFAFLPLWGRHLGFDPSLAVLLAAAMTLGNVVLQIPIGLIADRFDRRLVLLACGLVGSLGMAAAWAVSGSALFLMLVLLVWGGASAGLYTVGLAHLASRFSAADLAGANAAFVFCYALGMLVGPIAVGDAMARAPTFGFPLILGGAFAVYSLVVAVRIVSKPRGSGAN
ncbi:MAG: MFS transporter [Propylenella sp.]